MQLHTVLHIVEFFKKRPDERLCNPLTCSFSSSLVHVEIGLAISLANPLFRYCFEGVDTVSRRLGILHLNSKNAAADSSATRERNTHAQLQLELHVHNLGC